jgi:hypothetical protein
LFLRAQLDPGSDDTIFPLDVAALIGVELRPGTNHSVRWRGRRHKLEFADVHLALTDNVEIWRWPAVVAFSNAPIRYPLLELAGCLQFFDVSFRGEQRVVEIDTNRSFPGTKS